MYSIGSDFKFSPIAEQNLDRDNVTMKTILPYEIMQSIFSRLEMIDLGRSRRVCKQWNYVYTKWEADQSELGLWKYFCKKDFSFYSQCTTAEDYKRIYLSQRNVLKNQSKFKVLHPYLNYADPSQCYADSAAFSSNGKKIAFTINTSTKAVIFDLEKEACSLDFSNNSNLRRILFSPTGLVVATSSTDNVVKLWDSETGQCLIQLQARVGPMVFSSSGRFLVSGCARKEVGCLWNAQTGECIHTLEGHRKPLTAIAVSQDERFIATGSQEGSVLLWDVETGSCIHSLIGHEKSVTVVAFSHDGKRLATGSDDSSARIWSTNTGVCMTTLDGHSSAVTFIDFSYDDTRLLTLSRDGIADTPTFQLRTNKLRLWDSLMGKCIIELDRLNRFLNVSAVSFSPNGKFFAVVTTSNEVYCFDVLDGKCLGRLQKALGLISYSSWIARRSIMFSPDGTKLTTMPTELTPVYSNADPGFFVYDFNPSAKNNKCSIL